VKYNNAKDVYVWLWLSPLLTIPTLLAIISWNPGYEYFFQTRISIIIGVMGSALWHLNLLNPAFKGDSSFIRWHGRQALVLAGLRTLIPLGFGFFFGDELGFFCTIPLLIGIWFLGTYMGQQQAKRGECTLAGLFNKKILPENIPDKGQPAPSSAPTPEDDIESLIEIIRFSLDKATRSEAMRKLEELGVVENL